MAHISRSPSGSWKAVIRKHGWPMITKTFRIKRDAEDWARRTEDEMVRGVYIRRAEAERTTLGEALDRYLKEVTPTKKPSTQRGDVTRAKHLKRELGKYSLAALSSDVIAKYRDRRLASFSTRSRLRKPISNDTVRQELLLLSHLFNTALREWRLGLLFNPVANVRKPSPGRARSRRLSPTEEATIMDAVTAHSNPMLRWIVTLAIETGMRLSEITTLTRGQIDLQRRTILLRDTKNGSARLVPLSERATRTVREALAHPIRPIDTDLIFFGEPGRTKVRKPYEFKRTWSMLLRKAGITDLRFHDLRHEAVSRLIEAGLSDQEVATISGHKSMQMLRRYTHLRAEDLVAKLDWSSQDFVETRSAPLCS